MLALSRRLFLQKLRNRTVACKLSVLIWSAQVMWKGWIVGNAGDILCYMCVFFANLELF